MSKSKRALGVVMMTCRWCIPDLPEGSQIPGGGEVFSVQCTGSIRPDLIYEAFTRGAQGVLIIGCAEGECHFVSGSSVAKKTVEEVRDVFRRANIDPRRVRIEFPKNPRPAKLWKLVEEVRKVVEELGPLKIKSLPKEKPRNRSLSEIVRQHGGTSCLDCGKCTALCDVAKEDPEYSPRGMVHLAMLARREKVLSGRLLWLCRTCGRCSERCPEGVFFPRIIRALREEAQAEGYKPPVLHGDFVSFLSALAISPVFKNTWGEYPGEDRAVEKWPPEDLEFDPESKVAFYPGCLSFFESIFGERLGVHPMEQATAAVKILNNMGVRPRLMPELGCCGHDLYWVGRTDAFTEVAKANKARMDDSGVETFITACPECASTITRYYPKVNQTPNAEILHIFEYMESNPSQIRFHKRWARTRKVTYFDPCRLVRHMNIVEEPRKLLGMISHVELMELPSSGKLAYCCGTAGWTQCNAISKKTQVGHLDHAKDVGAETMLTACPKCNLHFKCARSDIPAEEEPVKIQDIYSFLAASMLPSTSWGAEESKVHNKAHTG